ncbi:hypothetical protein HanRHA438_Chr15g0732481 [Helianthus annuus]|nr:hypothetical protein HanRHA438_Chr15g0732481 [Helianthus annuus]
MAKVDIYDRGSKTYIPKISIKPGVENVYTQNFYTKTIYSPLLGVGRPLSPTRSCASEYLVLLTPY